MHLCYTADVYCKNSCGFVMLRAGMGIGKAQVFSLEQKVQVGFWNCFIFFFCVPIFIEVVDQYTYFVRQIAYVTIFNSPATAAATFCIGGLT